MSMIFGCRNDREREKKKKKDSKKQLGNLCIRKTKLVVEEGIQGKAEV
jgi:hypothetical protein